MPTQATEAYLTQKGEFDAHISKLSQLSANNFGTDPDTVDWPTVAVVTGYNVTLRGITDSAFLEGGLK